MADERFQINRTQPVSQELSIILKNATCDANKYIRCDFDAKSEIYFLEKLWIHYKHVFQLAMYSIIYAFNLECCLSSHLGGSGCFE